MSTSSDSASVDLTILIAELEEQQQRLMLASFGHDDAWRLGSILVQAAITGDLGVTVDVRTPRQVLFHHARPGTTADNDRWVERKSSTVFHYEESSWLVRQRFALRGADFDTESGLNPRRFAAHGGSFPLVVRHAGMVGAVTVSGLPQQDDHQMVTDGLAVFLSH